MGKNTTGQLGARGELHPVTEAGARLVKLAEHHAAEFSTRAAEHDVAGTFPAENFTALQASGVLAAGVPVELGGLGVTSLHDLTVGISRLGRGDGSTAIGACMHVSPTWGLAREWRSALAAGQVEQASALEGLLREFGSGQMICSAAVTEAGTTVLHPLTEAVAADGGVRVSGHKMFATNAPAADLFLVTTRTPDQQLLVTFIRRDTEGLEVRDSWDAMGMRASASGELVLDGCFVPTAMTMPAGPWGRWDAPFLALTLTATVPLLGAFLGIAEAARDTAIAIVTTRRKAPSGRLLAERDAVQRLIAEIEIALAVARATLARTTLAIDTSFTGRATAEITLVELHALMSDYQCTNLVVKQAAIAAVDAAMTASGGAGYLRSNPISRYYRDVRAGPFMQPYSPLEAYTYIGRVTLGLDPNLEG